MFDVCSHRYYGKQRQNLRIIAFGINVTWDCLYPITSIVTHLAHFLEGRSGQITRSPGRQYVSTTVPTLFRAGE